MTPVLIRLESDEQFSPFVAVPEPLGSPVSVTRTALHQDIGGQKASTGVWECSPGSWRRQVLSAEYSFFLSGAGCFTPDQGEKVEFQAGDAIYFAANTPGVWEIHETVRKTYLILG